MSINRVCISGNLTRSPELRTTQGGTPVLTFGLAVNERRRNSQTGEWEDYANFVDCVLYGKRAESLGRILAKGMKVAVEGRLHYSSWERDGQRRSKLEVVVDELELMVRKGQPEAAQGQYQPQPNNYTSQPQSAPYSAPQQPTGEYMDVYEGSDIPFGG